MKKFLQNTLARSLCVLAFGILLIVFAAEITEWIVMLCGLVFIIPGAVSLIGYFRRDPEGRQIMLYPIIAVGSILFGLVQVIWPELFIAIIMYILSGCLILISLIQSYTLWNIHKQGVKIHPAYYLVTVLELATGLYIALTNNKTEIAELPVVLLGCGFIIYSLLELWTIYLVRQNNKKGGEIVAIETTSDNTDQ
ncbi:MAG: DUF308 domain-containing protein [Prevotellamassilia sp.]|nr:DUF308 domain-containing protein [Prevotellamassilia sp.]MDD7563342.1 DUF308 domain-containing protein [Prevotellamassilia sp.]MDY2623639.1 DUF308 domain-containing protein [Alloprevotella sp.]MDY5762536.1 DUF308 domain-containing protein [Alloprevotella sp.]MDY6114171.1 DUF308 domain-containing protein [Alloprevotella sp.]